VLPGKWCGALDEGGMRGLLLWMDTKKGSATRLDLAIDDFERRVTPDDVRAAIASSELVSRGRRATYHETLRGDDGDTVYVGSRGSRVFARVYDKARESGGAIDAVRWELVLRKQAAKAAQRDLALKPWELVFGAQFARFVDFRSPAIAKVARRQRLGWYQEIIGDVTKARPYMPTPIYSAEKSMEHFRRNQAPTLAALVASEGGSVDFIHKALREGPSRWRTKHRLIAGDE
jgi:DNA relaxase NicK